MDAQLLIVLWRKKPVNLNNRAVFWCHGQMIHTATKRLVNSYVKYKYSLCIRTFKTGQKAT